MKKTLLVAIICTITSLTFAQNTFGLRMSEVSNDGTNFVISVSMQMNGDDPATFTLGSSSLQFTFPNDAISNPILLSTTLVSPFPYFAPSVTVPLSNQCSFNIELTAPDNGITIVEAPGWTELGQISFTVDDMDVFTPLFWSYNGGTTQTVVYLDDEATQIFAGSPTEESLIFEPLNEPDELIFTFIPGDATYDCDEDYPLELPEATSTCGEVTITEDTVVNGDQCATSITRIFTITDPCENEITTTQIINIYDTTAPVIFPNNVESDYQCLTDVPDATATATDNCDTTPTTVEIDELIEGECPTNITRTFYSVDACGNETTITQNIQVHDTIAPIISDFPEDTIYFCGEIPAIMEPTVIDNCTVDITETFVESSIDDCPDTITRTWTYTDACDNSSTQVQTITRSDVDNINSIIITPFTIELIGNSILKVTSENELRTTLAIYNSIGQVIYSNPLHITKGETRIEIDLSKYQKGAYLISLTDENNIATKTVIKQ